MELLGQPSYIMVICLKYMYAFCLLLNSHSVTLLHWVNNTLILTVYIKFLRMSWGVGNLFLTLHGTSRYWLPLDEWRLSLSGNK